MKKAYICHPYASNPERNQEIVRQICEDIVGEQRLEYKKQVSKGGYSPGVRDHYFENIIVPVASHLLFPEFMNDVAEDRQLAMDYCIELMKSCDEVWVYYEDAVTAGMREEISVAAGVGIPIKWKRYPREVLNRWVELGE